MCCAQLYVVFGIVTSKILYGDMKYKMYSNMK